MKKLVIVGTLFLGMVSVNAFAQSGGLDIPGFGSGKGSAGSTVKNSKIYLIGNKASNVVVGGGKISGYGAEAKMDSVANINSVNITGSTVQNSEIVLKDNEAKDVTVTGGAANINTVNIN
jgi:hypothetical protein